MTRKKLIGQRFGKLIVDSIDRIEKEKTYWKCTCDCGNKKVTHTYMLTSGRCKSCGCLLKTAYNKEPDRNKAIIKFLFNSTIKRRSKQLNLDINIDLEHFEKLIKQPCYYCGEKHSNLIHDWSYYGSRKYVVSDTILKFNGIDRIDNNKGYIEGNVVTCCKKCNSAKNSMTNLEFKDFICKLYNNYYLNEKK